MNLPSERRFPRIPFAKVEAGASPASSLEDLIEAGWERMNYEGRMMKWGGLSGAFSPFIIHPSSLRPELSPLLRLTADSSDLLAVIKQEGKV